MPPSRDQTRRPGLAAQANGILSRVPLHREASLRFVGSCLDRRSQRGVVDAFEAKPISFHNAVRDAFLALAECEPERVVRIDALQTPEQMCANVMTEIKRRFL